MQGREEAEHRRTAPAHHASWRLIRPDRRAYQNAGFGPVPDDRIDAFRITPGYRDFVSNTRAERHRRPSALRDVLTLPADVTGMRSAEDFSRELERFSLSGNTSLCIRGLRLEQTPGADGTTTIRLLDGDLSTHCEFMVWLRSVMGRDIHDLHHRLLDHAAGLVAPRSCSDWSLRRLRHCHWTRSSPPTRSPAPLPPVR